MSMVSIPGARRRNRTDPIGSIKPGKAFNHFPRIIAAFPEAISRIVVDTTEHVGLLSAAAAPVQGQARGRPWRRGDPAPGTLRASMRIRFAKRRGTDIVLTGRVDFKAKDPTRRDPNHRFAYPVEVGSTRRKAGGGYYRVANEEFLVPVVIRERPIFIARLKNLEAMLPR
jgi:hypothetical protein